MGKLGLVRHDKRLHRWYLTRAAVKIIRVIKIFEKFCTTYDLDDVNADGKIVLFADVINRKQENEKYESKIVDRMIKNKTERMI